jgi:hypothetical protein
MSSFAAHQSITFVCALNISILQLLGCILPLELYTESNYVALIFADHNNLIIK